MNHLPSRRDFLAGVAGFGASLMFLSGKSLGQSSGAGRIDVHHHFGSRAWIAMVNTKPGSPTRRHAPSKIWIGVAFRQR